MSRNPDIRSEAELPEPGRLPELTPRLLKGMQADYEPATYAPEKGNTSGLTPMGPNLLVLVDACASASAGGVLLPEDVIERMTEASVTGCIYAMGRGATQAFGDGLRVGKRVCFEKYAGVRQRGHDGQIYRIVDERNIVALVADDFCAAEI